MRLILKIGKIIAAIIIALTVVLFTSSLFVQDKVAGIILRSLNKNLLTKYDFESVKLSFLKRFPKASLDIRNAIIHSSPRFDTSCFRGINTDTLLAARSVTLDFSIIDIIRGVYNIDRIGIKEGVLNLYTDTSGFVNYALVERNNNETAEEFAMDLNRIDLSDVRALYNNSATKLLIRGYAKNGHLKSKISGDDIDFSAKSKLSINKFQLYDFSMTRSVEADFDVNLHSSDEGIMFSRSNIYIENNVFELGGFVSSDNNLDLSFTGSNIDLSGIKKYVPMKYLAKVTPYDPAGILNLQCKFKGPLTRTSNPLIEINFDLSGGSVKYNGSQVSINNLSFKGFYTNGPGMVPETSSVSISDFEGTIGSADYRGSLILSDFRSLNSRIKLSGQLYPSEIKAFFNLQNLSSANGVIDFDLTLAGKLQKEKKFKPSDLFSFQPEALLKFRSFSIGLYNDSILFNNVTGDIAVSDSAVTRNFKFTYNGLEFEVTGIMEGFNYQLSGRPASGKIKADIKCNKLNPELFRLKKSYADNPTESKRAFTMPSNLVFDIDFNIDQFNYKTFTADSIKGIASYKSRTLEVKSLNLNALNGAIYGSGLVAQNTDKTFIGKGNFNLKQIDIKRTFTCFNNFGQSFIKAENLDGSVSGSLALLIPFDSLLNPVIKRITAEGKYIISKGALIEFEPVMELSSFIELSELKNIHFEELENDFFIRNNYLYIPQMEVKSSAADLSVSGKHDFENNYEYHLKILLSEILSRKFRKPRSNTTEFGSIQDDGLGRTSLLLKIANIGDDVKVSYDIKAVGNQIKNDIKTERQTLRKILNEEYRPYLADSVENKKPARSTPRFQVVWEERDTIRSK
jgi:hypothetical protein